MERGLPQAGETMSDGPSKCPRCGGALDYDCEIEKAVRYKDDVALVRVRADVCAQCGERLFRPEMVDLMEQARFLARRRADEFGELLQERTEKIVARHVALQADFLHRRAQPTRLCGSEWGGMVLGGQRPGGAWERDEY